MNWSEVTNAPSDRMLRQFAWLWLALFGGVAAWRVWDGDAGALTQIIGAAAIVVGLSGLAAPRVVRPIFTGWMILAFPIGWTVSRLVLLLIFFGVFTPFSLFFRLVGRDVLRLRGMPARSYWTPKPGAKTGAEYLRQY
jgi:hypothetical protein